MTTADPAKYYSEMVSAITDHDLRAAARQLSYHVGEDNAITIEDLAYAIYHESDANAVRRARLLLERLIEDHGFPVCSHSGKAGRWLPGTMQEAIDAAEEREARAAKLLASAKRLRAAKLPAALPRVGADAQPGLF